MREVIELTIPSQHIKGDSTKSVQEILQYAFSIERVEYITDNDLIIICRLSQFVRWQLAMMNYLKTVQKYSKFLSFCTVELIRVHVNSRIDVSCRKRDYRIYDCIIKKEKEG